MLEGVAGQSDSLKQGAQLLRPSDGVPPRRKARHAGVNLLARHAIRTRVAVARTQRNPASRKRVGDNAGELADLIVLAGAADVENLPLDRPSRSLERAGDGVADVEHMDQRAVRRSVAGQANLTGRPGE